MVVLQSQEKEPEDPARRSHRSTISGIWEIAPPKGRLYHLRQRLRDTFASSIIWVLIVAAPLTGLLTIYLAYYLGGVAFFGPTLLLIWSVMIVSGVIALEKSGHAQHFSTHNSGLTRSLAALCAAFAVYIAIFYLLLFLARH